MKPVVDLLRYLHILHMVHAQKVKSKFCVDRKHSINTESPIRIIKYRVAHNKQEYFMLLSQLYFYNRTHKYDSVCIELKQIMLLLIVLTGSLGLLLDTVSTFRGCFHPSAEMPHILLPYWELPSVNLCLLIKSWPGRLWTTLCCLIRTFSIWIRC